MRNRSYLFGLELTSQEADTINRIHAERLAEVKYPQTLNSLVDNWSYLVAELKVGYGASEYEYDNDIDGRRVIDKLLPTCPERIKSKILELLDPLDQQFFELTEPDEYPRLTSISSDNSGLAIDKWSRIPRNPQGDLLEFLNLRER